MSYSNRELVEFYVSYKLAQKNYSFAHFVPERAREENEDPGTTEVGRARTNGAVSRGASPGPATLPEPRSRGLQAVKEALRDSANEFELRYQRAFSDLSSQLHITPGTAYQSFESVMNEVFRDGVNWGRIVGLFAFGGALCVECVEKEMSHLVARIMDWMTVYLDNHIQPWIQSQGGWDRFAEIFGNDAAAESRRWRENVSWWLMAGLVLFVGAVLGSIVAKRCQ
ncbi:bcl-2-like protein 1 [Scleropages formosus]|uniref:Bcl-2-like protein 1 n=1 Tax=Scleropages formosus TaxID=113540 RepID=A0A8C9SET9_SCLFO|nr:bcl-2-like protein 1 [Scleropages formosus]XP_018594615.1 bcl-2-like protein 1 [Scleropages formosus]XP_018594616.1 bcl-2-like protein 1 [Scleropages formosus]